MMPPATPPMMPPTLLPPPPPDSEAGAALTEVLDGGADADTGADGDVGVIAAPVVGLSRMLLTVTAVTFTPAEIQVPLLVLTEVDFRC